MSKSIHSNQKLKILFTGASSFTGYWFVNELTRAGHQVTATLFGEEGKYKGVRERRVQSLSKSCQVIYNVAFGDSRFMEVISSAGPFDVFCHHAAHVYDYNSMEFDPIHALQANTNNLNKVVKILLDQGCGKVAITGSIFEPDEGVGTEPKIAVNPYGLSKGLTASFFRYYCDFLGMALGKFVIPNPFGPYEEPRFTAYLVRTWKNGEIASVRTPDYIRDNIHVSLLSKAYALFISQIPDLKSFNCMNPSGYVESQGSFAKRFAQEMSLRLGLECPLELQEQMDFSEPMIRINYHSAKKMDLDWNESQAWDDISNFYA